MQPWPQSPPEQTLHLSTAQQNQVGQHHSGEPRQLGWPCLLLLASPLALAFSLVFKVYFQTESLLVFPAKLYLVELCHNVEAQ